MPESCENSAFEIGMDAIDAEEMETKNQGQDLSTKEDYDEQDTRLVAWWLF